MIPDGSACNYLVAVGMGAWTPETFGIFLRKKTSHGLTDDIFENRNHMHAFDILAYYSFDVLGAVACLKVKKFS